MSTRICYDTTTVAFWKLKLLEKIGYMHLINNSEKITKAIQISLIFWNNPISSFIKLSEAPIAAALPILIQESLAPYGIIY